MKGAGRRRLVFLLCGASGARDGREEFSRWREHGHEDDEDKKKTRETTTRRSVFVTRMTPVLLFLVRVLSHGAYGEGHHPILGGGSEDEVEEDRHYHPPTWLEPTASSAESLSCALVYLSGNISVYLESRFVSHEDLRASLPDILSLSC